jgi:predicted dehydrogenase
MTMDRPLRVGMIGTSFICEWMCDAARRTDVCVMHAVFSRDEARGKAFAEKEGIPLAFSDFQAFLNCPEIDAVYVASPLFHMGSTCSARSLLPSTQGKRKG